MRDYQDFGLDGLGALWVSKHLDSAQTFAFYPKVSKTMCLDFIFAAAKAWALWAVWEGACFHLRFLRKKLELERGKEVYNYIMWVLYLILCEKQ